jgi:hypothetical protein
MLTQLSTVKSHLNITDTILTNAIGTNHLIPHPAKPIVLYKAPI